jgi:outer membrane receptor protein involved in Fe transport
MLKTMTVRTTIAAILTGLSMSAHAIADTTRTINVPAGDLVVALESLAKQADIELIYRAEQLRGIRTGGVSGTYEPKDAVSLLLKGTQLTIHTDEATGVILVAPPSAPKTPAVVPASLSGQVRSEEKKSFWSRIRLAQSETPAVSQAESVLSEVVVTGSRIVRDGYQAPIPTTVLGAEALAAKAPVNIADFVNELPAFAGSVTPTTATQALSAGGVGINALNLRNLGANRTLILLDGQRVGASTLSGWVDVNQFPQALVKRVEVVTGGASADWGSDAIAGVVNFILDKEFTGIKGNAQGGVTTYGDNENYNVSLAAGTGFADGKGHVLFSVEYADAAGIIGQGDRKWYNGAKIFFNPAYTATNGQPQLINSPGVGFATATPGGIITSGPLRGTYFGEGGTPGQLNYGLVGGNFMQGGQWQYADYSTTASLAPKSERGNVFGRLSYALTDRFEVFAQASYTESNSRGSVGNQWNFGNLTIRGDNAFIPASLASQLAGTTFSMGSFNQDLGPIIAVTERSSWRAVLGANGDFDALGRNWNWDVYGQRTVNDLYFESSITNTSRYREAIDAVRNANGVIVCRSTLTNPNNGCVPYNIFGTGVVDANARNYVLGRPWADNELTEDVVAATLRGEPFSTWAGSVSIATGIEYREESVTGSNDPLATTNSYFAANYKPTFGSYNVKEGFFETVVPLLKDSSFGETLNFNGGVRVADYSTSGSATTWKAGLDYTPINDITFRVTRSRDIRAPNLGEVFASNVTSTASPTDPFRGNVANTVFIVTRGNPDLQPEVADTLGLGVVLRPSFLPDFAASIDYYDIDIEGVITTVAIQDVINQCFAGNAALCPSIVRDAAGVLSEIRVQPVNLATQTARGVDFELSYRHSLDSIPALQGNLTFRVLATRFLKNTFANGVNAPIEYAGTNSQNGNTAGLIPSTPDWRYSATAGWDNGTATVTFTARGVSDGVYSNAYIECVSGCPTSTATNQTINDNHVPGAIYFDTSASYQFSSGYTLYAAVDNIANRAPVQAAVGPFIGAAPLGINPALYDVLGRTFRVGARFEW